MDYYYENQHLDMINNHFTLEEMQNILEWVDKIKQFMWDEFYIKRAVEKEAVHDADLELFAVQKARELN